MTGAQSPKSLSSPEDAIDAAVTEILEKNNPHAYSTLTFIHRSLMQYNLASRVEPYEVLNEAYVRGKDYIHSGGSIRNAHAWLKSTSLNIIRELSRKHQKEQSITPELIELIPSLVHLTDSTLTPQDLNQRWNALLDALNTLSRTEPEGVRLLCLKAQGLSWKEIRTHLIQQGTAVKTESTLRQKACRAKKHLRKLYHSQRIDTADLLLP
ncbi:RNA polymerase sigma factor [Coleofasciculus sp. G2-EDA-02]|uniref:RNA polymerase sigma factor n=1 Tax=unclassified Coleofasciculus TaxID=2692782 RepID=UPI003304CB1F